MLVLLWGCLWPGPEALARNPLQNVLVGPLRVFIEPGVASLGFTSEQPENLPIDRGSRLWGALGGITVSTRLGRLLALELSYDRKMFTVAADTQPSTLTSQHWGVAMLYSLDTLSKSSSIPYGIDPYIGFGLGWLELLHTPAVATGGPATVSSTQFLDNPATLIVGADIHWTRRFITGIVFRYVPAFGGEFGAPALTIINLRIGVSIGGRK